MVLLFAEIGGKIVLLMLNIKCVCCEPVRTKSSRAVLVFVTYKFRIELKVFLSVCVVLEVQTTINYTSEINNVTSIKTLPRP